MSPRPVAGQGYSSYPPDETKVTCVEIPVGREDEVRKNLLKVSPHAGGGRGRWCVSCEIDSGLARLKPCLLSRWRLTRERNSNLSGRLFWCCFGAVLGWLWLAGWLAGCRATMTLVVFPDRLAEKGFLSCLEARSGRF